MSKLDKFNTLLAQFPRRESFVDHAGSKRNFVISCHEHDGGGYTFYATEDKDGDSRYEFKAFSESGPFTAFSALTNKVRESLATRHLDTSGDYIDLMAHLAKGRVTSGGVVVDGVFLTWERLSQIGQTYEGWEFSLRFDS